MNMESNKVSFNTDGDISISFGDLTSKILVIGIIIIILVVVLMKHNDNNKKKEEEEPFMVYE